MKKLKSLSKTLAILLALLLVFQTMAFAVTEGYVVEDKSGNLMQFNLDELKASYNAWDANPASPDAALYLRYYEALSTGGNVVAQIDDKGGYIDMEAIAEKYNSLIAAGGNEADVMTQLIALQEDATAADGVFWSGSSIIVVGPDGEDTTDTVDVDEDGQAVDPDPGTDPDPDPDPNPEEDITIVSSEFLSDGKVRIEFSEPLNKTAAETEANYIITGSSAGAYGLLVADATLTPDNKTITLTFMSPALSGGELNIGFVNFKDASGIPKNIDSAIIDVPPSSAASLTSLAYGLAANLASAAIASTGTDLTGSLSTTSNFSVGSATISSAKAGAVRIVASGPIISGTSSPSVEYKINNGEYMTLKPIDGVILELADNAVTIVYIKVTAQDGVTSKEYSINFTKGVLNTVTLLPNSDGIAGDQKITGLSAGEKYVIVQYTDSGSATTHGVYANGTLKAGGTGSSTEALSGTQITGLRNDYSYSVRQLSTENRIEKFSLTIDGKEYIGNIDDTAGTIVIDIPAGKDYTDIAPTVVLRGSGSTISPLATANKNFTVPVTYTVTPETYVPTKTYTVSVNKGEIIEIEEATIKLVTPVSGSAPSGSEATVFAGTPFSYAFNAITNVEWYNAVSGIKQTPPFAEGVSYKARIQLQAKADYTFTENTTIKVYDATTGMTLLATVTPDSVSNTGEKNVVTIYVVCSPTLFIQIPGVADTGEEFTIAEPDASLSSGELNLITTGPNAGKIGAYPALGSDGAYNAGVGSPAINQQIKALLSPSNALKPGDKITIKDVNGFSVISKIEKAAGGAGNSTIDLNSAVLDSSVTILNSDTNDLTVTGTAKTVILTGDDSACVIDISELTATGTVSVANADCTAIISDNQDLRVSAADTVIVSAGNTTGDIDVLSAIMVIMLGVEITPTATGMNLRQSAPDRITIRTAPATIAIDANTTGIDGDVTVVLPTAYASTVTAVNVTGKTATDTLRISGTMVYTGKLDIKGGFVDVSGITIPNSASCTPGTNGIVVSDNATVTAGTNDFAIAATATSKTVDVVSSKNIADLGTTSTLTFGATANITGVVTLNTATVVETAVSLYVSIPAAADGTSIESKSNAVGGITIDATVVKATAGPVAQNTTGGNLNSTPAAIDAQVTAQHAATVDTVSYTIPDGASQAATSVRILYALRNIDAKLAFTAP